MDHGIPPDLFAFLADPETYGVSQGEIEIIETHASIVFLAGEEAYKLYKHVNFGYLDYGSPEKRLNAAEREVELNRPFAPSIYLGLRNITREPDGYAFEGDGETAALAVHMRRFPQAALLSAMADRGELKPELIVDLASVIIAMHDAAPVQSGFDQARRLGDVLTTSREVFVRHENLIPPPEREAWANACNAALKAASPLLHKREQGGYVRRCHGDLHLGNLVLIDGAPTPFDALEFDEVLATTDVLYDLAFLLMDLAHRRLLDFANGLLSAYCARVPSGAIAGLAALPLWMSSRAAIRAVVAADRSDELDPGSEREKTQAETRAYFATAQRLLQTTQPKLLAIGGLSGTGKTTLARAIAPRLARPIGAIHLRSDVERKILAGVGELDALPPEAYAQEASDAVYQRLREKARIALEAGVSVIVDAVHAQRSERAALEAMAKETGADFFGLWLDAPAEIMKARVRERTEDASDADENIVRRQLDYDLGEISWRRADAGALQKDAYPPWLEDVFVKDA